jgi:hypothetical protein
VALRRVPPVHVRVANPADVPVVLRVPAVLAVAGVLVAGVADHKTAIADAIRYKHEGRRWRPFFSLGSPIGQERTVDLANYLPQRRHPFCP